jgi:hypothetical protein
LCYCWWKVLKLVILLLIMKTRSFKINCYWWAYNEYVVYNDSPFFGKEGKFVTHVILETD